MHSIVNIFCTEKMLKNTQLKNNKMILSSLLLILPYTLFEGLSLVNPFWKLLQTSCKRVAICHSHIKISEAFGKL